MVESTGQRIFFTTTARDFSRSCKVAAALALSGLDTMSEFQQAHEARTISFPPFGNCRNMRRVRHVATGEGGEAPDRTFVHTTVVAASPLQISQSPNTSYNITLEILKPSSPKARMLCSRHTSLRYVPAPFTACAWSMPQRLRVALLSLPGTASWHWLLFGVHSEWLPRVYSRCGGRLWR